MLNRASTNKAVVFFNSDNTVAKEMLYSEFEAVLDNIVGVPDFKGKKINAVYLHINQHLQVVAAVFFQVSFDANGFADKNWNIPLEQLADSADKGPNLGAGQIRLSCKSRCSVEWHRHEMWDPDAEQKIFRRLKAVVTRNRLSLHYVEPFMEGISTHSETSSAKAARDGVKKSSGIEVDEDVRQRLSDNFKHELKQRTSEIVEDYKLKMASMKSEAQEHIEKIHRQYREETNKLTEALTVARQLFTEEKQKNSKIKETLEKLGGGRKSKGSKIRRDKRAERAEAREMAELERQEGEKVLKLTEFVTLLEVANMMKVTPTEVISTCMSLGIMASLNQRLDKETLTIVADEFGFDVLFVDEEVQESLAEELENDTERILRSPIVTVMGHVDHGKTSLLDYIRKANVIAGEAGGITQHIGAYSVQLADGQHITFLDTPGHEAFTAMRARGAQVTDIAIIVVSADDSVMPQTKEAISHAQAAGVPIVFAINKIDRPDANPERIKEQLAGMNLLVEDWGGKIQSQDISAKQGLNVDKLLEKVLLEAELLDLKANPQRLAKGTVIEATLDKGRGYVTTLLVQNGSLRVGDYMLVGQFSGKVRAMMDERGQKLDVAGPSVPVSILGLDGAPTAGDNFVVFEDEREAKQIATRRQQLAREQSVRSQKNLTLEEIGRRLAVGDFKELNIVLKGDVDGSIEALADSLQRLSTEEIQVNIIHKAVGGITDSDVLLASASGAIIVGFQVRPAASARKLAEKEDIEIRLYSIIYDAINDIKDAMSGLLSPDVKEEITCTIEVRETFKISKVGTIAGCMVMDGVITRNTRVRVIRDGVVQYTGELGSLKRFKDDVREVKKGLDCGLNINNYNDIKVGDIVEGFKEVEVQREL